MQRLDAFFLILDYYNIKLLKQRDEDMSADAIGWVFYAATLEKQHKRSKTKSPKSREHGTTNVPVSLHMKSCGHSLSMDDASILTTCTKSVFQLMTFDFLFINQFY